MDSRLFTTAGLIIAVTAPAAFAQQLTTEQLTERFLAQKQAISEVRADPSLGRSRGISLQRIDPSIEGGTETPSLDSTLVLESAAEPAPDVQVSIDRRVQVNELIQFAFDSAELDGAAEQRLRTVCAAVVGADVGELRIVGHSDAQGDSFYNQNLSLRRAEAVVRFFVDACGIDPSRLTAVGVGEQFPFDAVDPFADVNRRVEFVAMG